MFVFEEPQPSTSRDSNGHDSVNLFVVNKRTRKSEDYKKLWNLLKLYNKLGTHEDALKFAEERGMIRMGKMCSTHKKPMTIVKASSRSLGSFVCNKSRCRNRRFSRAKGTWFENSKLSLPKIFYLIFAYSCNWSYSETIKQSFTNDEQCLSKATICDWINCCRETIVKYQMHNQSHRGKIGGPGKTVQIDESKFGQHMEERWVLGMIEDGKEDLRLEVCPDNKRSADMLIPLIQKHVAEGTTIYTDYWGAYDCLGDYGYVHQRANISDPVNTSHTQRIKSQFMVLKKYFIKQNCHNSENFADIICEYLWRRDCEKNGRDPFEELIKAINFSYNK